MLFRWWEGLMVCAVTGPQLWKHTRAHTVRNPPRHMRGVRGTVTWKPRSLGLCFHPGKGLRARMGSNVSMRASFPWNVERCGFRTLVSST